MEKGISTEGTYVGKKAIIVLFDNICHKSDLTPGWGFSCMIRIQERNILFDTGGDGLSLLGNMEKLGIPPADIDAVVLSHAHGDHTNGLGSFLKKNSHVTVYLPKSFPQSFKQGIKSVGAKPEEIHRTKELFEGVFTTGELPGIVPEQALVLTTSSGTVVITGCAHPGILNIVEAAKRIAGDPVYLVLGGFHFPMSAVAQRFKDMGVQKVAPCHCTGTEAISLFREVYGENHIEVGAGTEINIE